MYTGIIESTGRIREIDRQESGCQVTIESEDIDLTPDDSVGISGVCLTAEAVGDDWFRAFLSAETVERTYLKTLGRGARVNIEYPLAADGRFDGHVVKGTVDTAIQVVEKEQLGDDWSFRFEMPAGYEEYIAEKGAVAIDGISLTVADVGAETFSVAVVPATYELTTLSEKSVGDPVHLEADILAKYVERQQTVTA